MPDIPLYTHLFSESVFLFLKLSVPFPPLPETEHLFRFNVSNIIKETDDREYKNDGKCYKSEISTTQFQPWPRYG